MNYRWETIFQANIRININIYPYIFFKYAFPSLPSMENTFIIEIYFILYKVYSIIFNSYISIPG